MATFSISGDTKLIYKHLIYHECIIHMKVISYVQGLLSETD